MRPPYGVLVHVFAYGGLRFGEALVADRYEMMHDTNGWMWLWGWVDAAPDRRGDRCRCVGGCFSAALLCSKPHDRAHAILAERFARGEITSEEYRERAQQLR